MIKDIEPVLVESATSEKISVEEFWRKKSLEQLASEQGIVLARQFEDVFGKASELWTDEKDLDAFIEATHGI